MNRRLEIRDLSVRFRMPRGAPVEAVTAVTFDVLPGELVAMVGESGCGKSVLASALLGLLPANATVTGSALLHDPSNSGGEPLDLVTAGERVLARRVRGRLIGLIPQSPVTHLTPVRTIRSHLAELLPRPSAVQAVIDRAAFPTDRLDAYPFQLSGGQAQRAVTALALANQAWLLLADEPTTGLDRPLLDATVDELRRLTDQGHATLMITHDLRAARRVADRIAVMYAGRIVEIAPRVDFFAAPAHPYSAGLIRALPDREFAPIPGMPPSLTDLPDGCAFAPRCSRADDGCAQVPSLVSAAERRQVACARPLGAGRA